MFLPSYGGNSLALLDIFTGASNLSLSLPPPSNPISLGISPSVTLTIFVLAAFQAIECFDTDGAAPALPGVLGCEPDVVEI